MKCSVFIATSADGYIAGPDGDVGWLDQAGKPDAPMGDDADMGFQAFMASVDCLIMGRKTMEKLASFNLTDEQWPYGNTPLFVLSKSQRQPPPELQGRVRMMSCSIASLIDHLTQAGYTHAYVDGGQVITAFFNQQLINEITLTLAPVLLGEGISLFGKLNSTISLEQATSKTYPNDFIQTRYQVSYSSQQGNHREAICRKPNALHC